MKTYLDYKNQIERFEDVANIVKVIEKIAAASVHSLKKEVINLNNYTTEIEKTLAQLSLFYLPKEQPLLQKRETGKKMLVILTGDRELVRGLWHKIINVFLRSHAQYQSVVVVGTKGKNYLEEERIPITKSFTDISDTLSKEEIEQITNYIFNEFKNKVLFKVDILYPHFISLSEQQVVFTSFLPFEFDLAEKREEPLGLPIFEPSKKLIFSNLLQKYIRIFFHKIIKETKLSELSARTVAMEHASAKTDEFIQKTTLNYKKERRRFMTQKQLESFTAHKTI